MNKQFKDVCNYNTCELLKLFNFSFETDEESYFNIMGWEDNKTILPAYKCNVAKGYILAPTHAQLHRWLKKNFGYSVHITLYQKTKEDIFEEQENEWDEINPFGYKYIVIKIDGDKAEEVYQSDIYFNFYEECFEKGLFWCLLNRLPKPNTIETDDNKE